MTDRQSTLYEVGRWAIVLVIIAAIVAVVYVALLQFGIAIPGWVVTVFWVLVVATVLVAAIKFLLRLG
jgi:hypothetical protein